MNRRITLVTLMFFLLGLFAATALAETRYVSDVLIITLRSGQGEEFKILETLKTGAPLEVLEEGQRYMKVRTPEGNEGYVLKQYLTDETPKPVIISRLEAEVERLKAELSRSGDARLEAAELRSTLAEVRQELEAVQASYADLKEQSGNVLQVVEERNRLEAENSRLTAEVTTLREENDRLLLRGSIRWFLAGGGVFLFGWLAGKLSRGKRRGGFS